MLAHKHQDGRNDDARGDNETSASPPGEVSAQGSSFHFRFLTARARFL